MTAKRLRHRPAAPPTTPIVPPLFYKDGRPLSDAERGLPVAPEAKPEQQLQPIQPSIAPPTRWYHGLPYLILPAIVVGAALVFTGLMLAIGLAGVLYAKLAKKA